MSAGKINLELHSALQSKEKKKIIPFLDKK